VDISPIPGERANNPADKVRISRQPLDCGWRSAQCVVVRETEAPPEAGGGRGKSRKAQSEDRIQRLPTRKDRKARLARQSFDEVKKNGSQGSFRLPDRAVGNEEGSQGPTNEPAVRRGDEKDRKVRLRHRIEAPRKRAVRHVSEVGEAVGFPARLSGGRTGVLVRAHRIGARRRVVRHGSARAEPRHSECVAPRSLGDFGRPVTRGRVASGDNSWQAKPPRHGLRDVRLSDDGR
jgi:hypothetical protein